MPIFRNLKKELYKKKRKVVENIYKYHLEKEIPIIDSLITLGELSNKRELNSFLDYLIKGNFREKILFFSFFSRTFELTNTFLYLSMLEKSLLSNFDKRYAIRPSLLIDSRREDVFYNFIYISKNFFDSSLSPLYKETIQVENLSYLLRNIENIGILSLSHYFKIKLNRNIKSINNDIETLSLFLVAQTSFIFYSLSDINIINTIEKFYIKNNNSERYAYLLLKKHFDFPSLLFR